MVSYNTTYIKNLLSDINFRQVILCHNNCNQELIDALQWWETNQNIPGYLDYISTFSEELEKLQEIIEQEKNIQGKIEPYNQIFSDDLWEEQDEYAPWSTPKIIHYREEILAWKFYSSDEYEDFLYELFSAEHKFIDKWDASIDTPQSWYKSCLDLIDIILNYHQTAALYTLVWEYKLHVLENYYLKYQIEIDSQKILQEIEWYYKASLQYTPIEIDTHYFAIHFFYVKKDYKRAIEYIHTNISLYPKDYALLDFPELCAWYWYLWEFYYKIDQSTQAKQYFEWMLELADEYIILLYTKEDAKLEMQRFLSAQLYRYLSIAPGFGAQILENHYHQTYKEEYLWYIADLYYDASMYEKAIDYYDQIWYPKDVAKCYEKIWDYIQAYTAYHIHLENLENHLSNDIKSNKEHNEDLLNTCEKIYEITHKKYLEEVWHDDWQEYRLNEIIFIAEKVLRTIWFSREWEHRLVDAYYENDIINKYNEEDIYLDTYGRTWLAEKYIKNDDLKSALKACVYALKSMNTIENIMKVSVGNSISPKLSEVLNECIQKAEHKKLNDMAQQWRDMKDLLQNREE